MSRTPWNNVLHPAAGVVGLLLVTASTAAALRRLQPYKFQLNKIAARWPARAVAQFYFAIKKSSGKTLRNSVLLSYHTKQLNTESPTAYEKNSTFRRLPQSEL